MNERLEWLLEKEREIHESKLESQLEKIKCESKIRGLEVEAFASTWRANIKCMAAINGLKDPFEDRGL